MGGFWKKTEQLALDLSASNVLPKGELKERMFDRYEELVELGSEFATTKENRNTTCGSCLRRVRTAVMRHFQRHDFVNNGRLELRTIDGLDKRPIYIKSTAKDKK